MAEEEIPTQTIFWLTIAWRAMVLRTVFKPIEWSMVLCMTMLYGRPCRHLSPMHNHMWMLSRTPVIQSLFYICFIVLYCLLRVSVVSCIVPSVVALLFIGKHQRSCLSGLYFVIHLHVQHQLMRLNGPKKGGAWCFGYLHIIGGSDCTYWSHFGWFPDKKSHIPSKGLWLYTSRRVLLLSGQAVMANIFVPKMGTS